MADDTRLEDAYLLLNYFNQNQADAASSSADKGEPQASKHIKLLAIHLGAGNSHSESHSMELAKSICEEVMLQSRSLPGKPGDQPQDSAKPSQEQPPSSSCKCSQTPAGELIPNAEWAAVELVRRMENHQMLNCAFGSNLNIHGQVECDASLMSDRTQMWAGVGAVSGCKNPILLAKSLYDHRIIPRPLGLIQPNLLVSSGAKHWMRKHCPKLAIADSKLVSSKSFSLYQRLKSCHDAEVISLSKQSSTEQTPLVKQAPLVEGANRTESNSTLPATPHQTPNTSTSSTHFDHGCYCMTSKSSPAPPMSQSANANSPLEPGQQVEAAGEKPQPAKPGIKFQGVKLDTVGAVVVDSDNNFASAISSGGLLLKYKGRVGQAAIPGAGCWSEDSVAATSTGVGEYLTLNLFARKFYDKMLTLRMLYDLGRVEKKPDLSHLISCGVHECFRDLLRCPALAHVLPEERLAGMLSVCSLNSKECPKRIDENDLYLSYAHNTGSMCIGYMTSDDEVAHSVMSRYSAGEKDNRACVKTIKLSLKAHKYFDSSPDKCSG